MEPEADTIWREATLTGVTAPLVAARRLHLLPPENPKRRPPTMEVRRPGGQAEQEEPTAMGPELAQLRFTPVVAEAGIKGELSKASRRGVGPLMRLMAAPR